ncbi:peptidoglycan-binding protein [Streptomyces sp. NPDC101237]|uniref:peptidoglycan-binding protein n=1 Tax=Streptomyces sp. NPDC101237 TaxID=3366139 RepID=UPI0038212CC6
MSTPPDPEQAHRGPVLEPVRVLRPRRLDALAELMREIREEAEAGGRPGEAPPHTGGRPGAKTFDAFDGEKWPAAGAEDDTEELPPVPDGPRTGRFGHDLGSGPRLRRTVAVVAVGAAALAGFGCALLLPGRAGTVEAARPAPSESTAPAASAPPVADTPADPDGAGTLRAGDSGPEVVDLEQRLLRIPDVYRDGSTGGLYDAALTAAVERFQIWYGISGDERGVYGDDTRRALESRTGPADG